MKKTKIIAGLFKILKPLIHIMSVTVIFGILGYLSAASITVCGVTLILSAPGMISVNRVAVAAVMIICAVLRGFLRYAEQKCGHYIAFRILAVVRDRVYAALRRLAPAKLLEKGRGELCSMVTSDVEQLEVFYAHTVSPVVIAAAVSVISLVFIAKSCLPSAAVALCGYITVGALIPLLTFKIGSGSGKASREKLGELNDCFLESLRGINVSAQFGITDKRRKMTEEKTNELLKEQRTIKRHESTASALTGAAVTFFTVLSFAVGMLCGADFAGNLIAAAALSATFGPVIALSNLSSVLTQTFASGERILSLLDEQPEVEENTSGAEVEFEGLRAEDVSFGYGEKKILDGFSFEVNKNKISGIMGKSGCGKSTAMGLMMRFWDCDGGKITMSGENIKNIKSENLRKNEGFMTQTTDLFTGTISDNMRIGKPDATEEEIQEACKKASIHDFIASLPDGYNTEIAELGENLSSGERQRIGLARAFLHNPPLLLLDEPTANLDAMNEGIILKSIKEKTEGTVVISSHRKSTLAICDGVLDMDGAQA